MKIVSLILVLCLLCSIAMTYRHHEGFVNYYKCPRLTVGDLNQKIFKKEGWNRVNKAENSDLYIPCGYTNAEVEIKTLNPSSPNQVIYSIPGCDQIVSKNRLWELLEKMWGRKGASSIMPESYSLSVKGERDLLRTYWTREAHKNKDGRGPVIILKKNVQQKKGLLLTRDWSDIRFARFRGYVVAQKYLENLYSIQGRKINLRLYLAVKCHKNVKSFFLYNNGKCIYTSKAAGKGGGDSLDFETNITSYKLNPAVYQTHPLDLYQLKSHLTSEGLDFDQLYQRIVKIIQQTNKAVEPYLCQQKNLADNPCFQLFGLDVIFTKSLKPYLLECNKGPSLKPLTDGDEILKTEMLRSLYGKMGLLSDDDQIGSDPQKEWIEI